MTITQRVNITDDYRVVLDVPRDLPKGETDVIIQFPFKEKPKAEGNGKIRFTRKEIDDMFDDCPISKSLSGILSELGDVDLDEWRMKRLAKHL
jgi:hypothetical protein